MNTRSVGFRSALIYTSVAVLLSGAYFATTSLTGSYNWLTRIGGAAWIFLLSMIILMPIVTPIIKRRLAEPRREMAMAKDPVCGMDVDEKRPPGGKSTYKGKTYYFCAPGCKKSFEKDPEKYLTTPGSHKM